jgi:hypothetical protein
MRSASLVQAGLDGQGGDAPVEHQSAVAIAEMAGVFLGSTEYEALSLRYKPFKEGVS